jgi:hypothetical protein
MESRRSNKLIMPNSSRKALIRALPQRRRDPRARMPICEVWIVSQFSVVAGKDESQNQEKCRRFDKSSIGPACLASGGIWRSIAL